MNDLTRTRLDFLVVSIPVYITVLIVSALIMSLTGRVLPERSGLLIALAAVHIAFTLLFLALFIFFVVAVMKNSALAVGAKALWIVAFFIFGAISLPLYYFRVYRPAHP